MTNITTEQYKDILKNVPNYTEQVPSVQLLLRKAVETFFARFGAYPELAGVAPGTIGIFGEQTQLSNGMAMPTATQMATVVVGRRAAGPRFAVVTSADVGKPHKVVFSFSQNRPLAPGTPAWLNYIKGVIDNYKEDVVPPFEAAIESSVPMGTGFGSSSAIEIATYTFLEILVGKKTNPVEKATACQKTEKDFADKTVGLVDGMATIMAKDRHAMLIDCPTNEVQLIPFQNPKIAFVAIDTHLKHMSFRDEHADKTKHILKACEILGVETLRECTEEDLVELENRIMLIVKSMDEEENETQKQKEKAETEGEIWTKEDYKLVLKRARFFIMEMKRINEAVGAWNAKDTETFGEKMKESHNSLRTDFDVNNPLLNFLVDVSLKVEGVLGSRMTGMSLGFGGGIISLMKKENVEKYCEFVISQFAENKDRLKEELKQSKKQLREEQESIEKKLCHEKINLFAPSPQKSAEIQEYLGHGVVATKVSPKKLSMGEKATCMEKKKKPCILKVERKKGGCKSRSQFQQDVEPPKMPPVFEEEKKKEEEPIQLPPVSDVSEVKLSPPTFYLVSPFKGARMMFVTKTDILRSLLATQIPQPKVLVKSALEQFKSQYGTRPEAIGLAPGTITIFGDFMEFHLGYVVCMAVPMMTVTVGGRNDTVCFSVKTTSKELSETSEMKSPLPCVRHLEMESRLWVNFVTATVMEFKGHVPGFNALVHSSVPIQVAMNSCAAFQASLYTFLEGLTRNVTEDAFEKADRCARGEYKFFAPSSELSTRCSLIKFFPSFLSKESRLMLINCRRYKVSHYFFDNPSYVFLVASCKENTTQVTNEALDQRLMLCMKVIDILKRNCLLSTELKHLQYLKHFPEATEEMSKRARYVITEHERTTEAVRAIKDQDYAKVGMLMNHSHDSLRDDYEVSSPQIEELVSLARSACGVLGAKMLGRGLAATILILIKLSDADQCIRYMKKNYKEKNDKPVFYIIKPSQGAYMMDPEETTHIP